MDEPKDPPSAVQWPEPPPFEPDLDLIGDLEQPQRSALEGDPDRRRRRRFWRGTNTT
jgi:hypothetical protein